MAGLTEFMINEKVQTLWGALQRGDVITDVVAEAGTYCRNRARGWRRRIARAGVERQPVGGAQKPVGQRSWAHQRRVRRRAPGAGSG
jgi:hypothetical protein